MSSESVLVEDEESVPLEEETESLFKRPLEVYVEELEDSPNSSVPSTSSEDERKIRLRYDITQEYWHIQKLVKFAKTGNQTATVAALCCLRDVDWSVVLHQQAIQDIGGVEVFINLLETNDVKCRLAAANILVDLSKDQGVKRCIIDLGGIRVLVQKLEDPVRDLKIVAAEIIYNVAQIRKARKYVRKYFGIPKLVDLMDVDESYLQTPKEELGNDWEFVETAKAASRALWSVSRSKKNIDLMMIAGVVPLLARLIRSIHIDVIKPTVGIIALCAFDPSYQLAIQEENMVKDLVCHLRNQEHADLRQFCADTLFKCCENALTRDLVRQAGGLDPLVDMLKDPQTHQNKDLLAAVTGAIWKTAKTKENVERYDQLRTVTILVGLLADIDEDERVLSNVTGALYECLKYPDNREILRLANGIPYLVQLLNYTYKPLLENLPLVLGECAEDEESMRIIEQLDGVRFIWSLLKNDSPKVQANAAKSLVPCLRHATDSGEMVRCFVGSLEIIVKLLKSPNNDVLACVCAAIAEIATDTENLAVISDYGVVGMLVNLVTTQHQLLRQHLCSAIAACCAWGANCKQFGRMGAITSLVNFMSSSNVNVQRTTATALYQLSKNAFNCTTMHECNVVPFLLAATASTDWELQEAAAGCLANIRKLALEAETTHLIRKRAGDSDTSSDEGLHL